MYQLRTEGGSPRGHALSVAAGSFVGSFPLYGLHVPICLLVGRLFGLNRVEMCLATQINNPITAPFLILAEIQLGSVLLSGRFRALSLEEIGKIEFGGILVELAAGSLIVGLLLALVLGSLTWRLARRVTGEAFREALIEEAARPFLARGFLYWERVRAALRFDPAYVEILRHRVLPWGGVVAAADRYDGTFHALAAAYRRLVADRGRPEGWPDPPADLEIVTLAPRADAARAARDVLGGDARIEQADLSRAVLPRCRSLLLIDVLQRYPASARAGIVERAAAALTPGGTLLVRERRRGFSSGVPSVELELERAGFEIVESSVRRRFFTTWRLTAGRRIDRGGEG